MDTDNSARATDERVSAGRLDDLQPEAVVRLDLDPPIAVFNVDGTCYAVDDTCSHAEASLADGDVEGVEVECPWHMGRFDLRTGRACKLPATKPIRTHAVEVIDGEIIVHVGGV